MVTDIAQGNRTEQGITQGMNGDITIGVSKQSACVGYFDSTQHDMIPVAKSMYVQALPDPVTHGFNLRQTDAAERILQWTGLQHR